MKVLMVTRRSAAAALGGDTIQIWSLARELENLGCDARIDCGGKVSVADVDLLHIFNIDRPHDIFQAVAEAKKSSIPVLMTPIFVDYREFDTRGRRFPAKAIARCMGSAGVSRAKVLGRAVKNGEFHSGTWRQLVFGSFHLQKLLLDQVDMFLPNSVSEMRRLCRYFGLDMEEEKWSVVENGVDPKLFRLDDSISGREGVLCVARVEGLKNQLNLVLAMKGLPWTLTLIGAVAPNHSSYLSRVLKESGENVRYLGQIPQSELPGFYQRAKVHVLPSWFETTGLSSLEAGAMGCNIVVAKRGDVTEYFQDRAFYCEPDDISSIREAVRRAYEEPLNSALRERILNNCTWEKAALKTFRAYEKVLDEKS